MAVRLGLIGAGRWGRRYIETSDRSPDVQIVRVCTRHPELAAAYLSPQIEIETDWRRMCSATDLDGIIIATPPSLHAAMLHACLDAGIPTLVEKPLCVSLEEAIALERHAQAVAVPVLVGHTHLFHAAFEALRAAFPDPAAVRFIHAESAAYGPFRPGQASVLWDRGPHPVAMCLDLLAAQPDQVVCLAAFEGERTAWDNHMLTLRLDFAGGTVAWIQVGHLATQKRTRLSAFGRDRILVFDDLAPQALVEHRNAYGSSFGAFSELSPPRSIDVSRELPLDRVLREFLAGLSGQISRRFGLGLAVAVTRTLDAAAASAASGTQPVRLAP